MKHPIKFVSGHSDKENSAVFEVIALENKTQLPDFSSVILGTHDAREYGITVEVEKDGKWQEHHLYICTKKMMDSNPIVLSKNQRGTVTSGLMIFPEDKGMKFRVVARGKDGTEVIVSL